MELYYNTLPTAFGNLSGGSQPPDRSKAQFNGNISATSWSSIRDKEITNANIIRGFTYSYDKMNRLITANFQSVKPEELGRYSTAHSYDVNGNIQTTQRSGVISSNGLPQSVVYQYGQMDNMQYSYAGNRLMKVNDAITTQTTLPDFNDNGSTDIDYGYDNNGNLTKDLNKKIESIAYNHLNLPIKIIFTGKGDITYTYNAAGAKLTKTVTETGKPVKTVAYKYGFLFENEVLKEFATPEGRIVAKTPPSGNREFQFQYHYKDHLGNVRMTFASENPLTERITLTSEQDSLVKEKGNFANVESVRTDEKGENSDYSVRVSAYSPAITSKVLRIEKGGSLSLRAAAKYEENKSILLKNNKLMKFKAADLLPLVAVTPVNFGNSETKNYAIGVNILGLIPISKKIVNVMKSPIITPKKLQNAVIEISFYKDSLLSEQIFNKQIPVSENAAYDWEVLKDSLIFEESGFVRVSLRNSNSLPVLFDNLELRTYGTQKARIIQENHYEPFGMTLMGLDYVAEDTRKNNYLYNGFKVERQEELGLFWDDSHARNYDMQGGRFVSVDPMTDEGGQESWSSYHYSYDNPVRYNDPDGKCPDCWEFANGFANAVAHNGTTAPNGAAIVPLQQGGSTSFSQGQTAGHVFSLFTGAVEIAAGFIGVGGSGGATIASGGTLAPVAVVVGLESVALAAHGGVTAGNALHNLAENKGLVNANGNAKSSNNPQHGYVIKDKATGEVHKYGVSGGKLNNNGTSQRANTQVNQLNQAAGSDKYKATVVTKNVTGKNGKTAREKILQWEQGKVNSYSKSFQNKTNTNKPRNPDGNIRPNAEL